MKADTFHDEPFDPSTETKLRVFELYAREWIPVFLSRPKPICRSLHIFDFFAGPGTDSLGTPGSPLRLLRQLKSYSTRPGWLAVEKHVHLYDAKRAKVRSLAEQIDAHGLRLEGVFFDVEAKPFDEALDASGPILADRQAAKLVFIDQFGVGNVGEDVFKRLAAAPVCDFLFFISSSVLLRFAEHPAIKQKIERPDDYYHVHRAVCEYYRSLLPAGVRYFLAPFSIKRGANIYGLIFGSAHPLGIDKFLQVTWSQDEISGEAKFDIHRDDMVKYQKYLAFKEPTKFAAFEAELEKAIRDGRVQNELHVMQQCYAHGVKRSHAKPVLTKLKKEGVIRPAFQVPNVDNWKSPRPLLLQKG